MTGSRCICPPERFVRTAITAAFCRLRNVRAWPSQRRGGLCAWGFHESDFPDRRFQSTCQIPGAMSYVLYREGAEWS